jgi:hypothetical protein
MWHFLLWGIALALLIIGITAVYIRFDRKRWRTKIPEYDFFAEKTGAVVIFIIIWLLSPLCYEFSGWPESIPVTFASDGKVIEHPYGVFTIGLKGKFSNIPRGKVDIYYLPSVTLLTDNPKVRTINHSISVRLADPAKFYNSAPNRKMLHWGKRSGFQPDGTSSTEEQIGLAILNRVYDFNNAHSRDLAQLFNPLEAAQQKAYRALLTEFLGAPLANDGLVITEASFGVR